eukprot:Amastigsp_a340901_14.p3 type:complete len:188 gc:universal Amastigsp_a340901_14:933-370(-)
MPWPANAASPWRRIGITLRRALRSLSPLAACCLARALPSTTGLTASRCEGLASSVMWMFLPVRSLTRSYEAPRWYLTSPEPSCSSVGWKTPANSRKILSIGLRTTFARTLRRPRCGIPMTTVSTPKSDEQSMSSFSPGMSASPPSSPKRFSTPNFFARNASNWSDHTRRSRRCFLCASVSQKKSCLF